MSCPPFKKQRYLRDASRTRFEKLFFPADDSDIEGATFRFQISNYRNAKLSYFKSRLPRAQNDFDYLRISLVPEAKKTPKHEFNTLISHYIMFIFRHVSQ